VIDVVRLQPCVVKAKPFGITMFGVFSGNTVYLIKDNRGIAEELSACLTQAGINNVVTDVLPQQAFSAIFLKGLDILDGDTLNKQLEINESAFAAAKVCGEKLIKNPDTSGIFVTVQDTGGDFGIQSIMENGLHGAGLSGLVKTARHEWKNATVKAIDIECGERSNRQIAHAIFTEILHGGMEIEVGLKKNGERITLVNEPVMEPGEYYPLKTNDVVLVSGGARGITASCLAELTKNIRLRIAIFGRTRLSEEADFLKNAHTDADLKRVLTDRFAKTGKSITPLQLSNKVDTIIACRDIKRNLQAIAENGSVVEYHSLDITKREELSNAITEIRQKWGRIDGIIHAAGVLADKLLHEKSMEQFKRVFGTKVIGLYHLLEETKHDDLTHICLFSSVSARYGNKGQADYAMANEVLNKVGKHLYAQRNKKCLVKSINWGPWDGGMVTPALRTHFESEGVTLLSLNQGAKHFVEEITHIDKNVEVVIGSPIMTSQLTSHARTFAVRIHQDTHPFIASHMIKGVPVVPVAYMTELCLKLAHEIYPEKKTFKCRNFKVLKGIVLQNYDGKGDCFFVNWWKQNDNLLTFEIKSDIGIKHYTLDIVINPFEEKNVAMQQANFTSWMWDTSDIYNEKLFHGDEFRVIKELKGISKHGCSGLLYKKKPLNGLAIYEELNSAILDGGLQLALLWRLFNNGEKSLPTGYKELEIYANLPYGQDIMCHLEVLEANKFSSKFNILFTDLSGQILSKMAGVEMHILLPSTHDIIPKEFRDNDV
jgi:NAD(P)-dependent dehydrogenase (short-subunit alcohol dehydrogenase family)